MGRRAARLTWAVVCAVTFGGCGTVLLKDNFNLDTPNQPPASSPYGNPTGDEVEILNGTASNPVVKGQGIATDQFLALLPVPDTASQYEVRFWTSNQFDPDREQTFSWEGTRNMNGAIQFGVGALDSGGAFRIALQLEMSGSQLTLYSGNGLESLGSLSPGEYHKVFIVYRPDNTFRLSIAQRNAPAEIVYPSTGYAPAIDQGAAAIDQAARVALFVKQRDVEANPLSDTRYNLDEVIVRQKQ